MLSTEKGVGKMTRYLLLFSCVLALASSAVAQTKISRSIDCDKADPMHVIQIPDREGFSYMIGQYKCTLTKPMTIEGLEAKDYVSTNFGEVMGTSVRTTSTGVTHFINGDKLYGRSTGTIDQKALTSSGKWTYTSGTGKLRGIKGSGTYTCKSKGSESGAGYTCESEGEYTLPAARK
jgi:hypothetical protein